MHIPSSKSVDLVLTYLKRHSEGLSHEQLLKKLTTLATPVELTAALTALLNKGAVLYAYRASEDEFPREDEEPCARLAYFVSNDYLTTVADPTEVERVLEFIEAHYDDNCPHAIALTVGTASVAESEIPIRGTQQPATSGDALPLNVTVVYEHFAGEMVMPKVGFILDLLRKEAVVKFLIDESGTARLVLAKQHQFTVIAQDIVQERLRWFHVRAGTVEKAIEKVQTIPEGAAVTLDVTGTVPGWLVYTPAPTKSFCIERL